MTKATAVLEPGKPVTLAPAGNISFEIAAGRKLKLTQPEGEQVADLISFNRDDVTELLSMHTSRAVNLNWRLTAPHVLYSNRSGRMWEIEADLTNKGRDLERDKRDAEGDLQRRRQKPLIGRHLVRRRLLREDHPVRLPVPLVQELVAILHLRGAGLLVGADGRLELAVVVGLLEHGVEEHELRRRIGGGRRLTLGERQGGGQEDHATKETTAQTRHLDHLSNTPLKTLQLAR